MIFKKILVIKLRSMGDTVLLSAPLAELRARFPKSTIHVAVTSQWTGLLEGHPGIDKIWKYDRREEKAARAKAIARLALKLRKEKYDLVINFHASPSSSILAFATGAKTRSIHFHGHHDKNRYSTVVVPGKGEVKPIIERDMDAIRALKLSVSEGRLPKIFLSEDEKEKGKAALRELFSNQPGKTMAISLGASRSTKIWPIDRFSALAVRWVFQQKGKVFATVGPGEESLAREFKQCVKDHIKMTVHSKEEQLIVKNRIKQVTELPLRDLAALFSNCEVFSGNDSGPKHIAVAVGLPTVTLLGPEHPYEWHPYPKTRHPYLYIDDLDCRRDALPGRPDWCGIDICKVENHKCMRQIRMEQVFEECIRVSEMEVS